MREFLLARATAAFCQPTRSRSAAAHSEIGSLRLLILDKLSYVRREQAETSVLFERIPERCEHKSLAITANMPLSQWVRYSSSRP